MKAQKINSLINILIGICLVSFLTIHSVQAQQTYKIVPNLSKMVVKGTSNLHDWEINVTVVNGELVAVKSDAGLKQITSVSIQVPAKSLQSGKGQMDSKTQDALKSTQNPTITYQSTINNIPREGSITSIGQLDIAGSTKSRTISATYEVLKDGSIHVKGNIRIKMTDFAMIPPTAIMGTLKVADEVEIDFDTIFK